MLGIDPEIGTSALRLWIAAGAAAFLIVACAFAFFRSPVAASGGRLSRVSIVVGCAALGAAMTWSFLDRSDAGNLGAERRALELRAQELTAQTFAPGSPLACLDAVAGEGVEAACEKALFASPAGVATASSYVAARFALLTTMAAYVKRGGADIDDVLLPLRRALEADRFGFLAHVLAVRDGCTSQNCGALALLRNASRVRANLSDGTFDHSLEHYQAVWAAPPDVAPAEGTAQAQPNAPRKLVNIDFPSAASIPAISIMNPEPGGPVVPGAGAAAAANPNGQPAPQRRARRSSAGNAAQSASPAPAAEPIWPEPVPLPPAQPAAAPAAPIQLNPPLPATPATARTQ